jgi:hypothetical protein
MTLLPTGTGLQDSGWVANSTTAHGDLDDDNGDTSYVSCTTDTSRLVLSYANPTVAEADINTITSVRFLSSGRSTSRRTLSRVVISYEVPDGFDEDCDYDPSPSSYETINGTARTAKPDSSAWEYSDLEDFQMRCVKETVGFSAVEVRLSYLAIEVTYTEPVAGNATFFGANF